MLLTLDETLARLDETEAAQVLQPHWEESMARIPLPFPDFLRETTALRYREQCSLPSSANAELIATCRAIQQNQALVLLQPFKPFVEVYRHQTSNQVVALAADGMKYTADGYVPMADETAAWIATLRHENDRVTGYVISPRGFATRTLVTLPTSEWVQVLKPGDQILDLHIPAGGSMNPWVCAASMRTAVAFFHRYFPAEQFVAFSCHSWILGNRTSLQRAVADYILEGNTWRGGGMFFLVADLDRLGTQVYWNSTIWRNGDLSSSLAL